jgi:hypothetical protein
MDGMDATEEKGEEERIYKFHEFRGSHHSNSRYLHPTVMAAVYAEKTTIKSGSPTEPCQTINNSQSEVTPNAFNVIPNNHQRRRKQNNRSFFKTKDGLSLVRYHPVFIPFLIHQQTPKETSPVGDGSTTRGQMAEGAHQTNDVEFLIVKNKE